MPAARDLNQSPARAYVGLGSNLDDPIAQVERAMAALDGLPHSRVRARSRCV